MAWATTRGVLLGVAGASAGSLLSACARAVAPEATTVSQRGLTQVRKGTARALVGDVLDFELTSGDWEGDFGFVTFRLHAGVFDGSEVYFIRTDASDRDYASDEQLVFVPKIAELTEGLTGDAYVVTNGTDEQAVVLSSEPGRDDYTPAWHVHIVTWKGDPRTLSSVRDVEEAGDDIEIAATEVVANLPVVKWSGGEMPVDDELTGYLGPGQLISAPDTEEMEVTFKLHECFPEARYIVTDTSMQPMAEGMNVVHSPGLAGATDAKATGRVNVFMGGVEGPGPMGGQPSVFDSEAGDPVWSPFWDHMTYAWPEGAEARLLRSEDEIHEARDAGELEEFVGTPDTDGQVFVVNCPVPVSAPNTFRAAAAPGFSRTGDGSLAERTR